MFIIDVIKEMNEWRNKSEKNLLVKEKKIYFFVVDNKEKKIVEIDCKLRLIINV